MDSIQIETIQFENEVLWSGPVYICDKDEIKSEELCEPNIIYAPQEQEGMIVKREIEDNEDKSFYCNICQKEFKRKFWFDKHASKHNGNKCSNSNQQQDSKDNIRHSIEKIDLDKILKENVNTSKKQEMVEIVVNNQKFSIDKAKNSLQPLSESVVNMNTKRDEKPSSAPAKSKTKVCPHCEKCFAQTGDLTRHIRTHTGQKPFKCTIANCKFSFISSGDLKKHLRRHDKSANPIPRDFSCDICGKAFERKSDVSRHKMKHLVETNQNAGFKCDLCEKVFVRFDQLKAHTYRHLSIKPHKCDICNKAMSDLSNLRKHKRTHKIVDQQNHN